MYWRPKPAARYKTAVCGRVFVKSSPKQLLQSFAWARTGGINVDDFWPRSNGAPRRGYPIIVREPDEPGDYRPLGLHSALE
jgi:hypothetical protein